MPTGQKSMANSTQQPSTRTEDTPRRNRDEVLRDLKLAIAQNSNYGRESRLQGSNPYDSQLGRSSGDVWGGKRPK
jgi:hypothetical protein